MSKRAATSVLNQDNWNDEDPPEEVQEFRKAAPSELKMRAIKKARRRGAVGTDGERPSVFKNFTAFTPTTDTATPSFSFLTGDSEKLKLNNIKPFPSFSFSGAKSASDTSAEKGNSDKEQDSTPKAADKSKSFLSSSKDSESSSAPTKDLGFKFGVPSNSFNSPKVTTVPAFSFTSPKDSTSSPKIASAGGTFKFGIDSKPTESSPSVQKTTFHLDAGSKPSSSETSTSEEAAPTTPKVNGLDSKKGTSSEKNSLFLANLKALNLGVLKWVKQHLDKNQYVNLSPICDDYKKYYYEIKQKYDSSGGESKGGMSDTSITKSSSESLPTSIFDQKTATVSKPSIPTFSFTSDSNGNKSQTFKFGVDSDTTDKTAENVSSSEPKGFTFGVDKSSSGCAKSSETTTAAPSGFFSFGSKNGNYTFGASSGTDAKASTFSFGASKEPATKSFSFDEKGAASGGFSFKMAPTDAKQSSTEPGKGDEKNDGGEDGTYEPPKEEVTEVKEDDAIYEKKVKLFYKKDDKYTEKGVGTLFLKPAGEKTQLVVRALTNLGNILLNIILNDSIPTQRMGKNNVLLVCVPNPPVDTKAPNTPVSILVRVKTEQDADELLAKIDEYKKAQS